ncbi:MAG TPA: glycosyltransferase family 2 protein [Armatimonadota bacterium]|jgi:glycosyltransferase involved in cell wall biosynthesis
MLKFTIITPSYNQAGFIEKTLESVRSQGYPEVEHLVLDGGSTDGTQEILRAHEGEIRWVSEPDRGQSDAINKGFRQATGDVVAWLNSDDVYLPGALWAVANHWKLNPHLDMVVGDGFQTDLNGNRLRVVRPGPFDVRRLIARGVLSLLQPACFWRRSVIERVGALDLDLHYAMDYDFFIRIGLQCQVGYLPEPLACLRVHSDCKTISGWEKMVVESHGIRAKHLKPGLETLQARAWDLRLALFRARLFRKLSQAGDTPRPLAASPK